MQQGELAKRYQMAQGTREPFLQRGRAYAKVSIPSVLAELNFSASTAIAQNFQSIGARIMMNLTGFMSSAMYPIGHPWYSQRVSPNEIELEDPDLVRQVNAALLLRERIMNSLLRRSKVRERTHRRPATFQSQKFNHLQAINITGESLQRLNDDFRLVNYRRDQYVTVRDEETNPVMHIVEQKVDPLGLRIEGMETQQILEVAGLPMYDLAAKPIHERLVTMYLSTEWNYDSKKWVTKQELNGQVLRTSEDVVSGFISTVFSIVPGEDYGRGFIEQLVIGDLLSVDNLREKILNWASEASDLKWVLDKNSPWTKPGDLRKRVMRGEVQGGQVQNIARLGVNGLPDFSVATQVEQTLTQELARTGMLEQELQPQKERTTATQVLRIAELTNNATSGLYANIADEDQIQTYRAANYYAEKKRLVQTLPDDVDIETLTGAAVHQREIDAQQIIDTVALAQGLGEQAIAELDIPAIIRSVTELRGVGDHKVLKSAVQKQAEAQAALQQQAASRAADATIDTVAQAASQNLA